jgi:cyanate permease
MGGVRATFATVAAIGGALLAASLIACAVTGDGSEAAWIAIGPLPFYAVGLFGFLCRPGNRVVWWLLGVGVAYITEVALGDIFLAMAAGTSARPHRSPRQRRSCGSGRAPARSSPPSG